VILSDALPALTASNILCQITFQPKCRLRDVIYILALDYWEFTSLINTHTNSSYHNPKRLSSWFLKSDKAQKLQSLSQADHMSPTKCRKSAVCEIADIDYRADEFQAYSADTIRWADQLLELSSGTFISCI